MPVNLPTPNDKKIEKLLEENLKLNQQMHKMVKSIKNYVIGQRIWFVIKILIIVTPIVLGFIYLPPLLSDLMSQYKDLLNMGETSAGLEGVDLNVLDNIDLNSLSPELLKKIKQ